MATLESYVESLLDELIRMQSPDIALPPNEEDFFIPGQIAVGNDQFIITTREMERLIELFSRELQRSDPVLSRTHTDKEWNWMVRGAFGPALMLVDLDKDRKEITRTVIDAIRVEINEPVKAYGPSEHVFGCTLFGNFNIEPFSIGLVKFEPRSTWLERKRFEGDVSKITARRVNYIWSGGKTRNRKSSIDAMRERDILDAIGGCPYVCSVRTEGFASEAGRLKAQTAARLAMTGIALRWAVSSKALDGFRLRVDPPVRRQRSLVFKPKVKTLSGGNLKGLPHGPTISPEDWAEKLTEYRDDFNVVGEAITYYLSPDGKVARPALMNCFAQALLWFHEGCRDEVDLMAVVKFSACLDALASGRKSSGIRGLIRAQLGIQDDKPIRKDGPTMREAVDEIYSSGRSRTIHGTNEKIGNDWSSTRALAEQFARLCLVMCLDWAVSNSTSDDPFVLMK